MQSAAEAVPEWFEMRKGRAWHAASFHSGHEHGQIVLGNPIIAVHEGNIPAMGMGQSHVTGGTETGIALMHD